MSVLRPYVTIGSHHRGPHVDALYALAERCGAEVLVVEAHQHGVAAPAAAALPRLARRLPYAGLDRHENAHLRHGWVGGAAR